MRTIVRVNNLLYDLVGNLRIVLSYLFTCDIKLKYIKDKGEIQMIMNFITGTFQFFIAVGILSILCKYFLRRTIFGRTISVMFKTVWKLLKIFYRIGNNILKSLYKFANVVHKFVNAKYKKYYQTEHTQEKTAIETDHHHVIDFNAVKSRYIH